jgi:hypothetical protein
MTVMWSHAEKGLLVLETRGQKSTAGALKSFFSQSLLIRIPEFTKFTSDNVM